MATSQSPKQPADLPKDAPAGLIAPATAGVPIVIAAATSDSADPISVPGTTASAVPSQPPAAQAARNHPAATAPPQQAPARSHSAPSAPVASTPPAPAGAAAPAAHNLPTPPAPVPSPSPSGGAGKPRRLMATPPADADHGAPSHPATWAAATPVSTPDPAISTQPWSPVTGAWELPDMPDWQQRRHAGLVPGPDSGMIPTCYNRTIDNNVEPTTAQPPTPHSGSDMSDNNVRKPDFASLIGQSKPVDITAVPTEPISQTPTGATIPPGSLSAGNSDQLGKLGKLPRSRQYTPPADVMAAATVQPAATPLADAMAQDLRTDSFERVIAEPVREPAARTGNALVAAALICTVAAGVGMWMFLDHHKSKDASVTTQQPAKTSPAVTPVKPAASAPAMKPTPTMAPESPAASKTPEPVKTAQKPVAKPAPTQKPVKALKPIIISPKQPAVKPTMVKPVQTKPTMAPEPKPTTTPVAKPTVTKPVIVTPEVKLPTQGGIVTFAKGPFPGQDVAAVLVTPSPGLTLGENKNCAPEGAILRCSADIMTKDKKLKLDLNVSGVKPGTHSITFTAVGADDTAIDSQVTRVVLDAPAVEKPTDENPQPEKPAGEKPAEEPKPDMPAVKPVMPEAEKPAPGDGNA